MGKQEERVYLVAVALVVVCSIAMGPSARADDQAYAELSGDQFGIIDLTSGQFTLIASNGGGALGQVGGVLYAHNGGTLYTVNASGGSLTPVGTGAANLQVFGSTTAGLFGLDYAMNLYSVDPATGTATLIGSTGLAPPDHIGLSSGSDQLYLTAQYGTSSPALYLINISPGGGVATFLTNTPAVFGPVFVGGNL